MKRVYSDDEVRRSNSKDTHKWCRGKVGVTHEYEWKIWMECNPTHGHPFRWLRQVCNQCGRVWKLKRERTPQ